MHYHCEIIIPDGFNVVESVKTIMDPFAENDPDRHPHAFWDWYVIGGRYAGRKLEAAGQPLPLAYQDKCDSDISPLGSTPRFLECYTLIIGAKHPYDGELSANFMLHKGIWNGVTHQNTTWDGRLSTGLAMHLEEVQYYTDEAKARITPQDAWQVVTVDYHQ